MGRNDNNGNHDEILTCASVDKLKVELFALLSTTVFSVMLLVMEKAQMLAYFSEIHQCTQ